MNFEKSIPALESALSYWLVVFLELAVDLVIFELAHFEFRKKKSSLISIEYKIDPILAAQSRFSPRDY